MIRWLQFHRALVGILSAFLILGVTYSIVTPIFEAGDEIWHYPFVQHLATGHGLPVQDPNVETLWKQEGGQPPLYYAISALATFWIDTRDLPERLWLNPHARIGIPLDFGNKNLVVHTSAENFPWRNTTLAVHLIRLLSLVMSAGTVVLTYWFALEIKPEKTLAAFASAFVAFNPMFLFISASVNNDNLATLWATLSLVLMARLITRGATTQRLILLGCALGLGALTKISNLGLLGVAAIVFAYLLWQSRSRAGPQKSASASHPRTIITGGLGCAALVIAIAFWWYARNWILYGDPLAFNVWVQIAGGRPAPVSFTSLLAEFQGFRISFWGNFGGVNIIAPEWVYTLLDIFTLFALGGLLIGMYRRALPVLLALPAVWCVLINLSLVRWTWLTMASQGRLIFPAISALAILFTAGLDQCVIRNCKFKIRNLELRILNHLFAWFLFTFAALGPFTLIAPTYALPMRLADEARIPNPTRVIFDEQIELLGYTLAHKTIAPGEELPITLYWRARHRLAEDFSVGIRLIDAEGNVSKWDAFPGRGLYPTRLWQSGEIVVDEYRVPLARAARGPGGAHIQVTLYRRAPLENLIARDPHGNVVTPTIARFKIAGVARVSIENPVQYTFADQIALIGYSLARAGEVLRVKLVWRTHAVMNEDYTVFVHLVDRDGNIIAQDDHQPHQGTYPTSLWEANETVADEYALVLPHEVLPGDYRIIVGLYRASDGTRLPVNGGDAITLNTLRLP